MNKAQDSALRNMKKTVERLGGKLVEIKVVGEPFGPAENGTSDVKWLNHGGVTIKVVKQ